MALGGGTFTVQNKELPGAYINFVSAASANAALSDRGIATVPLELDWGAEGEIFEVTNEDSVKDKNQTQPKGITKRPCKDQIFLQSITKDKTD